ncbi:hypothetical protein DIURU_004253 [Diutina rugosa]|uniref:CID domain-containing protein n=1 Tax=Diutina rugosa TaxID=5481 RepID=A0A642UIB2_DIURU|nr:uncharacterized protein DIURU_004253 [Diutina rugosa]KAA8899586.1 hypothetical protein DIURU_004253 [Diutina rugosa]
MTSLLDDFNESLNELKFNSRPIIENLTTIAAENSSEADGILRLITERIHRALPEQKLHFMYLLDSICKNVGAPYNILVGDEIYELFARVFQLGDEKTRSSLVTLYGTWRVTASKSTPLFPQAQMQQIAKFLKKANYLVDEEQESLIDQTNKLISDYTSRRSAGNVPKEKLKEISDNINVLKQLRDLLSKETLKPPQCAAVRQKLNALQHRYDTNEPVKARVPEKSALKSSTRHPSPPNNLPQTPGALNAISLFRMLVSTGIIEVDQAPVPGAVATYKIHYPKIKYQRPSSASNLLDNLSQYSGHGGSDYDRIKFHQLQEVCRAIDSQDDVQTYIKSNDPKSSTPIGLLYGDKPSLCTQCGKRFANDEEGQRNKQSHLDWHFRINTKQANHTMNVQSRDWFIDDYEWVKFNDDDLLEYAATDDHQEKESDAMDVDELQGPRYVVVPENSTSMDNKCVICRETIKAIYNDELGEWVWPEAIRPPGESATSRRIMHITCFTESRKRSSDNDNGGPYKRQRY